MADPEGRMHPSRLHADHFHAVSTGRRLWRLALSLPWLAIRYCGPHPKGTGAAQSGRAALFLPVRHPYQGRLRSTNMSGPSTYNPKSGFEKWLDARLPLPRLMHDTMQTFPTPRNLNFWYTFGGILTFCLVVQIVTG